MKHSYLDLCITWKGWLVGQLTSKSIQALLVKPSTRCIQLVEIHCGSQSDSPLCMSENSMLLLCKVTGLTETKSTAEPGSEGHLMLSYVLSIIKFHLDLHITLLTL